MTDVTQVCGFCCTRLPLAELGPVCDGYQCRDYHACQARAAALMLYPLDERDLEAGLAAHEAMAGAVTRR